jgi:hypothetical protein
VLCTTGEVRFVLKDDISRQLDNGNVVLLSNLGFTAAGELLNCNTYDVGLNAAVGVSHSCQMDHELGVQQVVLVGCGHVWPCSVPGPPLPNNQLL